MHDLNYCMPDLNYCMPDLNYCGITAELLRNYCGITAELLRNYCGITVKQAELLYARKNSPCLETYGCALRRGKASPAVKRGSNMTGTREVWHLDKFDAKFSLEGRSPSSPSSSPSKSVEVRQVLQVGQVRQVL